MVFFEAANVSDAVRIDGRRSPGRRWLRSSRATMTATMVSTRDRAPFDCDFGPTVPIERMVRVTSRLCKPFLVGTAVWVQFPPKGPTGRREAT